MDNTRNTILEAEFIRRIQHGDRKTFTELYRAHYALLCNFALRFVGVPEICEEIIQDVFLNIWKRHEDWQPKGSPRAYLFKAVRNRALDYLKHRDIERRWAKQSYMMEHPHVPSPEEQFHDRELIDAVHNAINKLPERRKTIFQLNRDHGLTYQEIAEVLDISVKTVETQMGRSLKTLRKYLFEYRASF